MTSNTTPALIVNTVSEGQKFDHDGSIIFKVFVPYGVEATAQNGGIILEQGGGDDLKLKAHSGNNGNISGIHISGNTTTISNISGGSVNISNGRVFIDGREVTQDFNSKTEKQSVSGITSHGSLGDNVMMTTDGSVNIQDAGNHLHVNTKGSFKSKDIGCHSFIKANGSVSTGDIEALAEVDAGGSLKAGNLGHGSKYDTGGSAKVGNIGARTILDAGGSIQATYAKRGANLDAGGKIVLDGADQGIITDAGGKVKIGPSTKETPPKKRRGFRY